MPSPVALLDHFATLKDPRQHAKVLYPLPENHAPRAWSATLAGADDFVETVGLGQGASGVPQAVFTVTEKRHPQPTTRCAMCSRHWTQTCSKPASLAWAGGLRDDDPDIIAIDGENLGGAAMTGGGAAIPCIWFPAWAARQRIVLGQAGDRGEIQRNHRHATVAEASRSERRFSHHGCYGDANGHRNARSAMEGGDYCMSLKKNWPAVYADVEKLFNEPPDDVVF